MICSYLFYGLLRQVYNFFTDHLRIITSVHVLLTSSFDTSHRGFTDHNELLRTLYVSLRIFTDRYVYFTIWRKV